MEDNVCAKVERVGPVGREEGVVDNKDRSTVLGHALENLGDELEGRNDEEGVGRGFDPHDLGLRGQAVDKVIGGNVGHVEKVNFDRGSGFGNSLQVSVSSTVYIANGEHPDFISLGSSPGSAVCDGESQPLANGSGGGTS